MNPTIKSVFEIALESASQINLESRAFDRLMSLIVHRCPEELPGACTIDMVFSGENSHAHCVMIRFSGVRMLRIAEWNIDNVRLDSMTAVDVRHEQWENVFWEITEEEQGLISFRCLSVRIQEIRL